MSKNTVEPDRPQMTTWRMRTACWIPKATNTHTQDMQYLFLSHGKKWSRERALMLRYTYAHCPSCKLLTAGKQICHVQLALNPRTLDRSMPGRQNSLRFAWPNSRKYPDCAAVRRLNIPHSFEQKCSTYKNLLICSRVRACTRVGQCVLQLS
jgi:hypothetical protein